MASKSKLVAVVNETYGNPRRAYERAAELTRSGEYVKVATRRESMQRGYGVTVRAYQTRDVEVAPEGECQVCGRVQCLTKDARLVNHGYQRPGWGHIVGNCFGAGAVTYQTGTDALERVVAHCKASVQMGEAVLAQTKAARQHTFSYTDYEGRGYQRAKVRKQWVADADNWRAPDHSTGFYFTSFAEAHKAAIAADETELWRRREALAHFEKRLAASPALNA